MVAHGIIGARWPRGPLKASSFRMPGAPFANWLVIVFLLAVTAMLGLDDDTRVALYVAPVWFGLFGLGYVLSKPQPAQNSS